MAGVQLVSGWMPVVSSRIIDNEEGADLKKIAPPLVSKQKEEDERGRIRFTVVLLPDIMRRVAGLKSKRKEVF